MFKKLRSLTKRTMNLPLVGVPFRVLSVFFPFGIYAVFPLVVTGIALAAIMDYRSISHYTLLCVGFVAFMLSYTCALLATPFKKFPKRSASDNPSWNILYRRLPHFIFISVVGFFVLQSTVSFSTVLAGIVAVWFSTRKSTKAYEEDVRRTMINNNPFLLLFLRVGLFVFILVSLPILLGLGELPERVSSTVSIIFVCSLLVPPISYIVFRYLYSWKIGVGMVADSRIDPENNYLISMTVPPARMEEYVTARKKIRDMPIIRIVTTVNTILSSMDDPPVDSVTNPSLNIGFDELAKDASIIEDNRETFNENNREYIDKLIDFADAYERVTDIEDERVYDVFKDE